MPRQLRKAAGSAAVALVCGGAMLLGAGAAQAAPRAYTFHDTTLNQTFSGTACPEWVTFTANCLSLTVKGKALHGEDIGFTGVVALETGSNSTNRAERRGTITTPSGPVAIATTGTYNPADGSASYRFTQIPPDGSTFASLAITVAKPSTYDAATGSGTGTETWTGKIATG